MSSKIEIKKYPSLLLNKMPEIDENLLHNKIYVMIHPENVEEIYVGRTNYPLHERLKGHISQKNSAIRQKYSREYCEGFKITLLEAYPCLRSDVAHARETMWIDKLNPSINIRKKANLIQSVKLADVVDMSFLEEDE